MALVECSKHNRKPRVEPVAYAPIDVGSKVRVPRGAPRRGLRLRADVRGQPREERGHGDAREVVAVAALPGPEHGRELAVGPRPAAPRDRERAPQRGRRGRGPPPEPLGLGQAVPEGPRRPARVPPQRLGVEIRREVVQPREGALVADVAPRPRVPRPGLRVAVGRGHAAQLLPEAPRRAARREARGARAVREAPGLVGPRQQKEEVALAEEAARGLRRVLDDEAVVERHGPRVLAKGVLVEHGHAQHAELAVVARPVLAVEDDAERRRGLRVLADELLDAHALDEGERRDALVVRRVPGRVGSVQQRQRAPRPELRPRAVARDRHEAPVHGDARRVPGAAEQRRGDALDDVAVAAARPGPPVQGEAQLVAEAVHEGRVAAGDGRLEVPPQLELLVAHAGQGAQVHLAGHARVRARRRGHNDKPGERVSPRGQFQRREDE